MEDIPYDLMKEAKLKGYADRQIAHLVRCLESEVFDRRVELGIERSYRLVDTCAAEFVAQTPYYYSTFCEDNESPKTEGRKVVVLGSGPNRIGQGIEFDYCCVHGVMAARAAGYEAIMINCNPETVSTDSDTADRLYFEPVFWEHIYDIIRHEKPEGVIVQLGGQTALKLAEKLDRYGIPVLGTSYQALDIAEDRGRFSTLLKELGVPYPKFGSVTSAEQGIELSRDLGFPLLVRPSYVLGGQRMKIVINETELEHHVVDILRDMPDNKILLDHFLEGAIECEADAICDGEDTYIIGIMQHIEPAGIHSGDSYAVLPPYNLGDLVLEQIEEITKKVAVALGNEGPAQHPVRRQGRHGLCDRGQSARLPHGALHRQGLPGAVRPVRHPGHARREEGEGLRFQPRKRGYAIKIPVFSYSKFPEVNKELGPEMKSTGEAIQFIDTLRDPFFRKIYSERNLYLSK